MEMSLGFGIFGMFFQELLRPLLMTIMGISFDEGQNCFQSVGGDVAWYLPTAGVACFGWIGGQRCRLVLACLQNCFRLVKGNKTWFWPTAGVACFCQLRNIFW